MVKFIHISEFAFYERLTTATAMRSLAKNIRADIQCYDISDFRDARMDADSGNEVVVTFHAAHSKIFKFPVREMRKWFPNAKFVSLGSDSIAYLHGFKHPDPWNYLTCEDYEFDSPEEVDLHLDTLSEVVEKYTERGIIADQWYWTASKDYADYVRAFAGGRKTIDVMSLIAVKTPYRHALRDYLTNLGYQTHIGDCGDNLDVIASQYARSHVILGTTSGSWTPQRTMKGFRDWIAPALGSVLIYDSHPDIVKMFGTSNQTMPLYDYENPHQIGEWIEIFKNDPNKYKQVLTNQRLWLEDNYLEYQLWRLFDKHGIINAKPQ